MTNHHSQEKEILPHDEFGRGESFHWIVLVSVPVLILLLGLLLRVTDNSKPAGRDLVVYCAQDMTYAEPILAQFKSRTGAKVRAVYDSEAVKTAGLALRLIAERNRPRCDLFWGNEEMRTRQMASLGVFRETGGWTSFGYRTRRIVVNTNKLSLPQAPMSLVDLTNSAWRGKLALAYPQFGTTATHFHALRQHWGPERWEQWCRALQANKPLLLEGNSSVVKAVARGDALIGFTDSDDVATARAQGAPIQAAPLTEETLLIPNTLGIIQRGDPHPDVDELAAYLQSEEVVRELVSRHALEGLDRSEATVKGLQPDWDALLHSLDDVAMQLSRIFLR